MTINVSGDEWNEYVRIAASGDLEGLRAYLKMLEDRERKRKEDKKGKGEPDSQVNSD